MKSYARVVLCLVIVMLACSMPVLSAPPVRDGDPFTIGGAIRQPDGARVTLTAEQVLWRGRSGKSFAIKEWNTPESGQPRLVVASKCPLPVETFTCVDVTGVLRTVASRTGGTQRVLVAEEVLVYCSANGVPLRFVPFKMAGQTDWPYKHPLAESSMTTLSEGGLPDMPDLPEDPIPPAAPDSTTPTTYCGIADLPDGAYIDIAPAVCELESFAKDPYEVGYDLIWVDMPDRASGLQVPSDGSIYEGTLVSFAGCLATDAAGDRTIDLEWANIADLEYFDYPVHRPMYLSQKMLSTGLVPNGLLTRISGKVVQELTTAEPNASYFYIDDYSDLSTDVPDLKGIKVYDPYYTMSQPVALGQHVSFNGVLGHEATPSGGIIPVFFPLR